MDIDTMLAGAVAATPLDLARLIALGAPIVRARHDYAEAGEPGLGALVDRWADSVRATALCSHGGIQ
jgi:predicted GTPase